MDLHTILNTLTPLVKKAGEIPYAHFQKPIAYDLKGEIDLVTEADRETERFLTAALKEHFPDFAIVGEEGGLTYAPPHAEYFWYIDPIDGTTSFASHLPQFCVCVGLADRARHPLLGIIFAPVLDECFTAYEGGGAFMNDKQVHVTATATLKQSVIASDFPYDRFTNPDNNIREFSTMMMQVRAGRVLGSAALGIAYVAAGRLDGYWEKNLNPWDVLAGAVIVREAGGVVTDYQGNHEGLKQDKIRVIASNGYIHQALQDVINQA